MLIFLSIGVYFFYVSTPSHLYYSCIAKNLSTACQTTAGQLVRGCEAILYAKKCTRRLLLQLIANCKVYEQADNQV